MPFGLADEAVEDTDVFGEMTGEAFLRVDFRPVSTVSSSSAFLLRLLGGAVGGVADRERDGSGTAVLAPLLAVVFVGAAGLGLGEFFERPIRLPKGTSSSSSLSTATESFCLEEVEEESGDFTLLAFAFFA